MMTIGKNRFPLFSLKPLTALVIAGCFLQQAQSANVITFPGRPTKDNGAFAIVSTADTKMSHKKITVGEYVFVPQVGKCWNVGGYKLRKGAKVVSQGFPDEYWPNSTYFTVITPLIVPARYFPQRKLGSSFDDFAEKMPAPVKAITPGYSVFGSGSPEMIIERANCGAKCLYEYEIFSLGPKFKKLAKIETGNDPLYIVDIGGNGSIEALGIDNTFDCWKFSSAGSPRIRVMLRFKNGKPCLATDLMKTPAPSASYMSKAIAETKTALQPPKEGDFNYADYKDSNDILLPTVIPNTMLELIYSGNGASAWQYLDQIWPQRDLRYESTVEREVVTKGQFIAQFKEQLAKSPYWNDLKAMNGW